MSVTPWVVEIFDDEDKLIDKVLLPYQPTAGSALLYKGKRYTCGGLADSYYGPMQFAPVREAVNA
jgi:hypothetical protein